MDIVNLLHSTFKDALYFEFGEDFVKFLDKDTGKKYEVIIKEIKPVEAKVCAHIERTDVKRKNTQAKEIIDVNEFKRLKNGRSKKM